MTVSGKIGQLVSRQNVEQAVLALLAIFIGNPAADYLREIERQNGLPFGSLPRPPAPDSFYGGVDAETWREDQLPAIIVTAEPIEEMPERRASGEYDQTFDVQVTSIVLGDDEDSARTLADWYGTATMAVVTQHSDLLGFAANTRMTGYPKTTLTEADDRVFAQATLTCHVLAASVVNDTLGLAVPVPEPGDLPIVTTTNFELTAVPLPDTDFDSDVDDDEP